MSVKRRIESLEQAKNSTEKFHVIIPEEGVSKKDAKKRYCEGKGIAMDDLERPGVSTVVLPNDALRVL